MNELLEPPGLEKTLQVLEEIRDGNALLLRRVGQGAAAEANIKLVNHGIRTILEMALALKAAADGDVAPARQVVARFRIDEMSIEP